VIFLLCAVFSREVRTCKCEGTDPAWGSLVGISVIVIHFWLCERKTALTARRTVKLLRMLKVECSKYSKSQDGKIKDMKIVLVNFSQKGLIEPVSSQELVEHVCGANKLRRREHACVEASRLQIVLRCE